jgi:hypothetical protein
MPFLLKFFFVLASLAWIGAVTLPALLMASLPSTLGRRPGSTRPARMAAKIELDKRKEVC